VRWVMNQKPTSSFIHQQGGCFWVVTFICHAFRTTENSLSSALEHPIFHIDLTLQFKLQPTSGLFQFCSVAQVDNWLECYAILSLWLLFWSAYAKYVRLRTSSVPVNWQPVDRRNLRRKLPLTTHEFILKGGQLCVLYSVWQKDRQTDSQTI